MTLVANSLKIKEPAYLHRQFENDLVKKVPKDKGQQNQFIRVAQAALPFAAMYKPVGRSLTVLMGGSRTLATIYTTYTDISEGKGKVVIAADVFQAALSITSFACTIILHPLGMVVTTCHDLGINVIQLYGAWKANDAEKAVEAGLQILNNSVYLGVLFVGSVEILVASLGIQILIGIYQTSADFKKGNYLEVGAGVLMVTIRMKQIAKPISTLQSKWKAETPAKKMSTLRAIEENSTAKAEIIPEGNRTAQTGLTTPNTKQELIDVLLKYGKSDTPPLHNAIMSKDIHAVKVLVENGADINRYFRHLTPMHCAFEAKDIVIVQYLHSKGAKFDSECFNIAVSLGFLESIDLLISDRVPLPNHSGHLLRTLINSSKREDSKIALKKLVEYGADCTYQMPITIPLGRRASPAVEKIGLITDAISIGDFEIVKLLVEHGTPVNYCITDYSGNGNRLIFSNPLYKAITEGHEEIARYLLSKGAIFSSIHKGNLEIALATTCDMNKDLEKIRLVLRLKVLDQNSFLSLFPLWINRFNFNILKQLFDAAPEIESQNLGVFLTIAIKKGDKALAEWLLEKGAKF